VNCEIKRIYYYYYHWYYGTNNVFYGIYNYIYIAILNNIFCKMYTNNANFPGPGNLVTSCVKYSAVYYYVFSGIYINVFKGICHNVFYDVYSHLFNGI